MYKYCFVLMLKNISKDQININVNTLININVLLKLLEEHLFMTWKNLHQNKVLAMFHVSWNHKVFFLTLYFIGP